MMGSLNLFKTLHFHSLNEKLYFFVLCLIPTTFFLPLIFNSISLGLLGLLWIFNNPIKYWNGIKNNKAGLGFIALYVLHIIGLLYTDNMNYGTSELEYKLSMILIPLIVMTGPKFGKELQKVIVRIFYFSLFIFIIASYYTATASYLSMTDPRSLLSFFTYREFSSPMGLDPIYYALYIVFGIFAILSDRLFNADLSVKESGLILTWIMLIVFFVTLIFLSSRMEILVFIFCFGLFALYFAVIKKKWLMPILSFVIMLVASYGLISMNTINKERFTEMVDLEADYTENKYGGRSIRIEKWKNAIETWQTSPIMGVGTGDTIDALMNTYKNNEFDLAVQFRFNPHNQYLQTLVALGLIGLLVLMTIMLLLLVQALKNRDWLFVIFVLIASISMLTESMLERQKGLVFIVFFAMVFSQYRSTNHIRKVQNISESGNRKP